MYTGISTIFNGTNLENKLVMFEGKIGGLAFDRMIDKPKIAFTVHEMRADPELTRTHSFIIVRFHPPENETAEIYAALESMKLIDKKVKIEGTYIKENKNRFIIADQLYLENYGCKYHFTSEDKTRRIVERID